MNCRVHECQREAKAARGMCWAHYSRWIRYGHPSGAPAPRSQMERVWAKTSTPQIGCWLYRTRDHRAPRHQRPDGSTRRVALTVWEDTYGPLPDDYTLESLCGVLNCVRPDHHAVRPRSRRAA